MGKLDIDSLRLKLEPIIASTAYSETLPTGRVYHTPNGKKYPSVTTVISAVSDKSSLIAWKKRVGEAEAERITHEAATRGSIMHEMIENHLIGGVVDSKGNATAKRLFRAMSINFKRIDMVALEFVLWSDIMKVAGRVDCLGFFDGVLSIIDFKSSKKEKPEAWIQDYFIQTSLYAMMLYELTGIECKQVVILIAPEEGFPQVFKKPTADYARSAFNMVSRFHQNLDASRGASSNP